MSEGEIYEAIERFRRDLLSRERKAASEMVRVYGEAWKRIKAELERLHTEYEETRARGETPGPDWIYQFNRARAFRDQVLRELLNFSQYAEGKVREEQIEAIRTAEEQAERLARLALGKPPAGLEINWNRIDRYAVETILGMTQVDTPLHRLLLSISSDGAQAAEDALVQGMLMGQNPREVAREMRKVLGATLSRALTIARTETLRAHREATRASYQANNDIVKGWVWHSAADERTCASCFPAGVLVSGSTPQKVFSRHYTGDIVIIETTGGKHLPVTPNHPILTDHGWIKAGLLREGDNVICRSHVEGTAFGININDYHGPTPIEQVAKAFCMIPTEMPCSTPDFHGDGKGSDVYIVWSNGLLRNNREATRTEYFQESNFSSRGTTQPACLSFGLPPFGRGTTLIPRDLIWAGMIFENSFPGFQWYFAAPQGVGFRKGAPFDTAESQTSCNCRSCDSIGDSERVLGLPGLIASGNLRIRQMSERMAKQAILGASNCIAFGFVAQQATFSQNSREAFSADSESGCDLLGGLAGQISIDRILNIYVRSFSGQVYNLQTKDGWYQANDIIVHNCWAMHGTKHGVDEILDDHPNGRCGMVPITKTWAEIGKQYGIDLSGIGDTNPDIEPGISLFERLPAEKQIKILGPAKWAAWKDGQFALPDVVGRKRSREWGTHRYEKSLKELGIDVNKK